MKYFGLNKGAACAELARRRTNDATTHLFWLDNRLTIYYEASKVKTV